MTETTRKKNPVARKPKRKNVAKISPPTTSPTLPVHPVNPSLPVRTRPDFRLDQPPRYSILFPPDNVTLAHQPVQSLHPPSHATAPSSSSLPPPATDEGFPAVSSISTLARPVVHSESPLDDILFEQQRPSPEAIAHEALCDLISTKFDSVITSIDDEQFGGDEQELFIQDDLQSGLRGGWGLGSRQVSRGANRAIATAVVGTNYFAKVNLYANSKLPPNLPPLQL